MAGWGGSCCAADDCEGAFLPEALKIAASATNADTPRKRRTLRFFLMTPSGSASCRRNSGSGGTVFSELTVCSAISLPLPLEFHALVAEFHIARVHDLGNDVGSLAKVIVNEVRFAILHFVNAELLRRGGLDIGELVIVIDGLNIEGCLVRMERVIEL